MRHVFYRPDTERSKPLSEPVLLLLTSLAETPRHGYALMKDVESLSGGRVRLSTGTLYGAIRRLLEEGWIERFEQEDRSRDKQAYRLTTAGLRQLEQELNRMRRVIEAADARLKTLEARSAL
jgi:DNA-binding PadR family transcriptional regulator